MSPFNWTGIGPAPIGSTPASATTGRISALATNPTNANIIYVGAASGGIWKTTDGGSNWSPLTDFQASLNTGAIALAPSDANIIYAGTGEDNFTGLPGAGVLKSTNGGSTWTLLGQSVFNQKSISAIVVHPTNPNIVYATVSEGAAPAGIWKSTDGGTTWSNLALGGASMTGLVMDPTNPQILYAAAGWIGGNSLNGVYRTTDGGTTWSFAGNFPHNVSDNHVGRIALAIAPSEPGTLYAAIADPSNFNNLYKLMKTTNGNTSNPAAISWQDVTNNIGDVYGGQGWYDNVLTVDPLNANVVFVGGSVHFMTTINGGGSWSDLAFGLPNRPHDDYHALAFNANHKLLVGTDGGLYRLDNPGATSNPAWVDVNGLGLQITQFYHIALDPSTANIAFGASQDNGVEKFQDSRVWQGELCCDGFNVAVSSTNHNRVYADQNHRFFGSDNAGGSFTAKTIPTGARDDLFVLDPNNGDRILMGGNAVYESTNAGDSWTARNGIGWPATATIEDLAVSQSNPNTIYVVASVSGVPGTYVTTDDGSHWQHYNSPGNDDNFWDLKVDPRTNQVAYAVSRYGGIYRTTNGGQAWTDIRGNFPALSKYMIAIDPKGLGTDAALYVATDNGVYASTNLGTTWSRFNVGLPNTLVRHVELHRYSGQTSSVLAAGTYGRGLWETLVGIDVHLQGTTLSITGDANDDVISMKLRPLDPTIMEVWEGGPSAPFLYRLGSFPLSSFNQIQVVTGNGTNTVNIVDTVTGKPLTINLGSGTDTVNISPLDQTLDTILGDITVNGGGGSDTLNVNDQAAPTGETYGLSSSSVSRPGAGVISYFGVGSVVLNGGGHGNTINVESNVAGTTTTVNAGTGGSTINLSPTAHFLDNIQGNLTINGGGGNNILNEFDQNDPYSDTYTITSSTTTRNASAIVHYSSLQSVVINGGSGNVIYNFESSAAGTPVTINAGAGNDTFNLSPVAKFLDNIQGNLTLNGAGGTNTLNEFDQNDPYGDTYTITSTTTSRNASAQVIYSSIQSLVINGGSGNVTYNVTSSAAGSPITVNAGAGNNTLGGSSSANTWNVTASNAGNLTGPAYGATVTFTSIKNLTGGAAADNFILANGAGVTGNINGAGGSNTLDMSPSTANLTVNVTGANAGNVPGVVAAFSNIQNITTGSGNDAFVFSNGASVTGNLNGGGGSNTLNESAYTTAVTVDLTANTATGVGGGFTNLQGFVGGSSGGNTLNGPAGTTSWSIIGSNAGSLTGGFSFSAFGNLTGGAGDNTFVMGAGTSLSGTVTGGGGTNSLDYSAFTGNVIVDLQTAFATAIGGGLAGTFVNVHGSNLSGSGLYNLLIGAGLNTLTGGTGRRNILVAGGSTSGPPSTLLGGTQEDLLIGGTTNYDTEVGLTSWQQIAAYWAGTDPFSTRVNNLENGNGVPLLDATTVTGNGGGNTMNGMGELALIYTDGADTISGFNADSQTVTIAP